MVEDSGMVYDEIILLNWDCARIDKFWVMELRVLSDTLQLGPIHWVTIVFASFIKSDVSFLTMFIAVSNDISCLFTSPLNIY